MSSAVGKDIPHDSARTHVTGESVFIDDMPPARNELLVEVVGAPVAAGKLLGLEISDALRVPGVAAIITARDIPGHNHFGPIIKDEHLLVKEEITFLGDPICLIAADTREQLREAKKRIQMQVQETAPIFTIDDAIAAESFIGPKRVIACGDVSAAMAQAEHTLEGTLEIGGQEHFYLESQAAIALPGEQGQMTIYSSTQHPTETQQLSAEIIGVPFNHVTVICKRMGGGFGGKETQAAQPAAMAALIAQKTRRPTRLIFNKDDDMRHTGKRHPFKSWWKVGFNSHGVITALEMNHFSNGGCSADLSPSVLERSMLHTDNAYFLPNARITGQVCKTNLPSNTAFRGFGGPQGIVNIENIIEEIARFLQVDAMTVRQRNCYGITERNITPYGQRLENNTLPELFGKILVDSEYTRRRLEIDGFNASSKTHVKGLSATAVKFGISFTKRTLNQANALVNIYTDGTVLVTTGGTEMGQGLNTRVRQIVADELGIAYDSVLIGSTSTEKNNNTSPTAASSGTDLNGAAAANACRILRNRLAEFLAGTVFTDAPAGLAASAESIQFADGLIWDARLPEHRITFQQAVCRAYMERINLGERGFYITPGVDFNRETGKGHPFLYYTNGIAASEVLIDRFTGEMKVTRVDLLMDLGKMINPGLDRGQAVGGFIQGMGWVTNEELKYDAKGRLLSHSPTTYKIPSIGDLPEVFNVSFLDNPNCTVSIKGSKAMGEPPLVLGLSVWAAAKNAMSYISDAAARTLTLPATGEQLLMRMSLAKRGAPEPELSAGLRE